MRETLLPQSARPVPRDQSCTRLPSWLQRSRVPRLECRPSRRSNRAPSGLREACGFHTFVICHQPRSHARQNLRVGVLALPGVICRRDKVQGAQSSIQFPAGRPGPRARSEAFTCVIFALTCAASALRPICFRKTPYWVNAEI
jgi:hypothetical protein